MEYTQAEILQTVAMTEMEHLDVRTVTLGINLLDCSSDSIAAIAQKAGDKIRTLAAPLVKTVDEIGDEFGIRIANKRISVTPIALLTEGAKGDPIMLARAIDDAAGAVGVDFIGGYSALVQKGTTQSERRFLDSIPEALATTKRLCSSLNAATTRAGINMDVVGHVGRLIKEAAERTRDEGGLACAKFVCFANAVEDNPFMAGAFHGVSEAGSVINVGVSGPGVVNRAVRQADRNLPLQELAETIKKLSFKLARAGELVGREAARRLGIPFGIIDLSLAPTPVPGDSVANIIEAMGFERAGTHGTTAASRAAHGRCQERRRDGEWLCRRHERRVYSGVGRRRHDRSGATRRVVAGETGSMDQRLLRRDRHGCRSWFDFGRDDRGDHRRRDGDWRDEQQDHGRPNHSGARPRRRRDGRLRRAVGERADHARERFLE